MSAEAERALEAGSDPFVFGRYRPVRLPPKTTRRRGDCRLFLGLYQHRSFIQIVVTCVARPAAPEIDHLASKSLDGLVDFAFRPLWMGCRLHDKPVSPPYTFPFDLGQVSRFDQVETVERAVPAIARHWCYIVCIDDHRQALSGPRCEAPIPDRAVRQIANSRTDRLIEHVQSLDSQESRLS